MSYITYEAVAPGLPGGPVHDDGRLLDGAKGLKVVPERNGFSRIQGKTYCYGEFFPLWNYMRILHEDVNTLIFFRLFKIN
jgi:hypothetical protein